MSEKLVYLLPEEIVVDDKDNARWDYHRKSHNKEDIIKRCASFEEEGQLQPIAVRKIADKDNPESTIYKLAFGYLRYEAAKLYNKKHSTDPMKLLCMVADWTEKEAFVKNVDENYQRKDLTPMDLVYIHEILRKEHGWNDTVIAEHFHVTQAYVSQLKKLLNLTEANQEKVHNREISMTGAFVLAEQPPDQQEKTLKRADELASKRNREQGEGEGENTTEKPKKTRKKKTKDIEEATREISSESPNGENRVPPLRMSNIKGFFDDWESEENSEEVLKFCKLWKRFLAGKEKTNSMRKKLKELLTRNLVEV